MHRLVTLLVVLASMPALVLGGECVDCGKQCRGKPYCRLVCEMKKETKVEYDYKCEDFCLPGKSKKCGCQWIPTCGCVRTKKILVKNEVTKEVPVYKCVVEYRCSHCLAKAQAESGDTFMVADDEATVSDAPQTAERAKANFRR